MSKYGRHKRAYFADGVIIEADRVSDLKRAVRARRTVERYLGPVWFRPSDAWRSACEDDLTLCGLMRLVGWGRN